jgi:hypothetical protein
MREAILIKKFRGTEVLSELMPASAAHAAFKQLTIEQNAAWENYALDLEGAKQTEGALAPDDSALIVELRLWTSTGGEEKKRKFSLSSLTQKSGVGFGGGYDKAIDEQRKANGDTVPPKKDESANQPAPETGAGEKADPAAGGAAETLTVPDPLDEDEEEETPAPGDLVPQPVEVPPPIAAPQEPAPLPPISENETGRYCNGIAENGNSAKKKRPV